MHMARVNGAVGLRDEALRAKWKRGMRSAGGRCQDMQ